MDGNHGSFGVSFHSSCHFKICSNYSFAVLVPSNIVQSTTRTDDLQMAQNKEPATCRVHWVHCPRSSWTAIPRIPRSVCSARCGRCPAWRSSWQKWGALEEEVMPNSYRPKWPNCGWKTPSLELPRIHFVIFFRFVWLFWVFGCKHLRPKVFGPRTCGATSQVCGLRTTT